MKRGGKRLAGAVLLIAMLAIIVLLLFKTVFVVRSVKILGDYSGISEQEIVRASNIEFGKSLMAVDEAGVESGVNALGRVKYQYLELDYPNTVTIHVSERKSAAMLLHAGQILVLDNEGCVIESRSDVPNTDLIYISNLGVTGYRIGSAISVNAEKLQLYAAVMEAIEYHGASGLVSEINFADTQDIRIITRSGISVIIGDGENIRNKIAWMKAVVIDLEGRGESGGTLDVSSAEHADYAPVS